MLNLGFFNHTLCYRGTSKAIYNYMAAILMAKENTCLYYIFLKQEKGNRLGFALHLLELGVNILPVENYEQLINISSMFNFLYHVTSADKSGLDWFKRIRSESTLIHQVGYQQPEYSLSRHFAYTSYWQSFFFTNGSASVLPYIISSPRLGLQDHTKLRSVLGIPESALVLGRHGGSDTWNLPFASEAVERAVSQRSDLWFIYVGTPKFSSHERIIFLDSISSLHKLEYFFNACDAMIHARWEGETFGMACAEFLIRGKPIITWSESREQNHLFLAGRSVITYNTGEDLYTTLITINKNYIFHKSSLINHSQFEMYSPAQISNQISSLF